jgi:hypothetical protein
MMSETHIISSHVTTILIHEEIRYQDDVLLDVSSNTMNNKIECNNINPVSQMIIAQL